MRSSATDRFLIVGSGLSGILMAWELEKRGVDYEVWNSVAKSGPESNSATKVAAGMFNPVSFKRLVEVWNAHEHMNAMRETYQSLEYFLNLQGELFHIAPIMRVFPNSQYRDLWSKRLNDSHPVAEFLSEISDDCPQDVIAPYGFGVVPEAGWVDLPLLMHSFKSNLALRGKFFEKSWNFATQTPPKFSHVIDCRGVGATQDFASIGLKIASDHGEILTIKSPINTNGMCVNRVKWLLPRGDSTFKLGATYKWNVTKSEPTDEGRSEMLLALQPIIDPNIFDNFEITDHVSGLRPASTDRRPYAGPVNNLKNTYILNGLGTRGVFVGPTTASHLANFIFDQTPLPQDVRPARFFKEQ
ncbi:MAG: FAD-binding oxidoreductase [Bacteroidetes bacterium]|nr:FAD-binding oxidoreductase [Bacteroidota bacterium]